jgi:hypothetical protein
VIYRIQPENPTTALKPAEVGLSGHLSAYLSVAAWFALFVIVPYDSGPRKQSAARGENHGALHDDGRLRDRYFTAAGEIIDLGLRGQRACPESGIP